MQALFVKIQIRDSRIFIRNQFRKVFFIIGLNFIVYFYEKFSYAAGSSSPLMRLFSATTELHEARDLPTRHGISGSSLTLNGKKLRQNILKTYQHSVPTG